MKRTIIALSLSFLVAIGSFAQSPSKHQYVDLGLSVKWATCNIGATKPEEHGDFFSWGETENKRINKWETYKYSEGAPKALTKYCSNPDYVEKGTVPFSTETSELKPAANTHRTKIVHIQMNCVLNISLVSVQIPIFGFVKTTYASIWVIKKKL